MAEAEGGLMVKPELRCPQTAEVVLSLPWRLAMLPIPADYTAEWRCQACVSSGHERKPWTQRIWARRAGYRSPLRTWLRADEGHGEDAWDHGERWKTYWLKLPDAQPPAVS